MKDSIPQNEKHRMCISSCDLNNSKNNLCDFIKNDLELCRNSTDLFCFIHESIVLTHIIVISNNMKPYETLLCNRDILKINLCNSNKANFFKKKSEWRPVCTITLMSLALIRGF